MYGIFVVREFPISRQVVLDLIEVYENLDEARAYADAYGEDLDDAVVVQHVPDEIEYLDDCVHTEEARTCCRDGVE